MTQNVRKKLERL